jgi:hypothetical protein
MHWAGASSITEGITIDLGLINATTYHAEKEIASLQPGGSWLASYKELEKRTYALGHRLVTRHVQANADA